MPPVENRPAPREAVHEAPAAVSAKVKAITNIDPTSPRSIDAAMIAAQDLGNAKAPDAIEALIALANRPPDKHLIGAEVAAIRALGQYPASETVVAGLVRIVDRGPRPTEAGPAPDDAADSETGGTGTAMAMDEGFQDQLSLFLATKGAAINALGELRAPAAAKSLVLAMYRTPELTMQIRRALVAIGPASEQELLRVLRGDSAEVKKLFEAEHLDRYCGEGGGQACQPVSARDFYAAVALGDFYDPASVPVLLAALDRPAAPAYYYDSGPAPMTQYNAIFDSLRKIGAAQAAEPVHAICSSRATMPDSTSSARSRPTTPPTTRFARSPPPRTRDSPTTCPRSPR